MSSGVLKSKRNLAPESEEDGDEDGYVKIRYQQLNLPSLEIPTEKNGDLQWKLVRALDSKIIGLAIQSKERRRFLKVKNGVVQEPKIGWKSFKIIALLEESDETCAEEAIRSTVSSRRGVSDASKNKMNAEKKNVPAKEVAHSINDPTKLCNQSLTTALPELACIAKPVNETIRSTVSSRRGISDVSKIEKENAPTKDFAYSTNISDVICNPTSSLPELACIAKSADSTSNVNISNFANSTSVHDSSVIANDPANFDLLCAAFKVDDLCELKNLIKKQFKITLKFSDILCRFLKNALILHADKNVFSLLNAAQKSNIFYKKLDPTASDVCELCQQSMTIGHLLKKEHLKKYDLKFNQEIPEINNIVNYFYSDAVKKKLKIPTGFTICKYSNPELFEKYKDAFIQRINEQNLVIPVKDPLFLDLLLFLRKNSKGYAVPEALNPYQSECLFCEKPTLTFHRFIRHTLSMNHIQNAFSQEDLKWFSKILLFIKRDINGYEMLLPLLERKPDDNETTEDAVNEENSMLENSSFVHYSSVIAEDWSIFDGLCAAYKVDALYELKELVKKQTEITTKFFDLLCRFLRKALILHANKNVFSILISAEKSNILYNQIDPDASDVCELCEQQLTIQHLLKKKHLKKHYQKFNEEIPEINKIILYFSSSFMNKKVEVPYGFEKNTHSDQQFFDDYQAAFCQRISQQKLRIPIHDQFFLDRILFLRKNSKLYAFPQSLIPDNRCFFPSGKPIRSPEKFINNMLSINYIKEALCQEDLYWLCTILSYIQDDENGYRIDLPARKRKAEDYESEASVDTVTKKRSKMF